MRFTFPHFETKPEAVQPDYAKWQQITVGMSRDEVIQILGKPRDDEYHPGKSSYLNYGYIRVPFCPHPRTYAFSITFDENGNVFTKQDPFNGRFSTDGRPSQPELIIPAENQVFSHYPRVLDIRWFPVSGVYPVKYTVQLGYFPFPQLEGAPRGVEFRDDVVDSDLVAPYAVLNFGGANPGRVRVKACNKLGEGQWSEYRCFRFTA